jgi:hypothetical protein
VDGHGATAEPLENSGCWRGRKDRVRPRRVLKSCSHLVDNRQGVPHRGRTASLQSSAGQAGWISTHLEGAIAVKKLWSWLVELDRILRGDVTRLADLKDGSIKMSLGGVSLVLVLLGMIYGLCMAVFALITADNRMQLLGSAVKVPALFILTLAVTLPSLYVFNALVGSRLTVASLVRLFVAALAVNLAVLSSLGPIIAFFALSTTSYSFIVLLNVLIFAVSGVMGLGFLLQTLHRLNIAPRLGRTQRPAPAAPGHRAAGDVPDILAEDWAPKTADEVVTAELVEPETTAAPPAVVEEAGPLDAIEGHVLERHTRTVFDCWMIVFGLVGAQMSWVLRPFIGSPDIPFEWLRPRGSNFFEAVWHALRSLLS